MKAPSTGFKVVLLLLLLPAGMVVLFLAHLNHRHDNSGFGSFHGFVKAKLSYLGPDRFFSVTIEGRSTSQWHWIHPRNFRYNSLKFEWFGEAGPGKGQIDTASMTLRVKESALPVSRSSLSKLLFDISPRGLTKADVDALDSLERFMVEAGRGRLLPPKHGYHRVEEPLVGSLAHFSLGSRYPYSLYWWCGFWAVTCLWIALRPHLKAPHRVANRA